jgi:alkyl sulfatase BDS1-like metallo-beta-lactamase superfamily hydrolase
LNNSALTSIRDFQIPNPDLTVTVNRSDIEKMLLGAASFEQLASAGKVRLEGDSRPLEQLRGMFVQFDIGFEILPGTMPAKAAARAQAE